MTTKKFQGLKITHVKERLSTYRIQLNDNTLLDLPKIELGEFVPSKGMFIRLRFYRNLILQRVEFDGTAVINRSVIDIMSELMRVDDKLEDDVRKECGDSGDIIYDGLEKIFQHRVDMLRFLPKVPEFEGYWLDMQVVDYETAVCAQAQKLAKLGGDFLNNFREMTLREQQLVLQNDIEQTMIDDVYELAEAYSCKPAEDFALENSKVLNVPYCINLSKEEHKILKKAYLQNL